MKQPNLVATEQSHFGPPPSGPEPSWITGSFADPIWYAHSAPYATPSKCDFSSIAAPFRLTCKYLLWALEFETDSMINRRRINTASGYLGYFYEYRRFTEYLSGLGLSSFQEVTQSHCKKYIDIRISKAKGREFRVTQSYSIRMSTLFERLFKLGPAGTGTMPDGLYFNYVLKDVERAIGTIATLNDTPIMPDDVARDLFNKAVEFLRYSDSICLLLELERGFELSKANLSAKQYSDRLHRAREQFLHENGFVSKAKAAIIDIQPIEYLTNHLRHLSATHSGVLFGDELTIMMIARLNVLLGYLTAACFIVFAFMTGFRSGEILSLRRDGINAAGGRVIIRTRVSKGSGREGGVETDRLGLPILKTAHSILVKIAETYGRDDDKLWLLPSGGQLSNQTLSPYLQKFLHKVVGDTQWTLTSRQFRRYFAIFFIRRFQGPEDALRYHFRHVSPRTLESYIRDKRGAAFLLEAKQSLALEIRDSIFHEDGRYQRPRQYGLGDKKGYAAANLGLDDLGAQLTKHAADGKLQVWPTTWGYCMLPKDESLGAVCGGKDGLPNALEVYPANCGKCPHLVVGQEHLGFWQHTRAIHEAIVNNYASTELMKVASNAMISRADAVLRRHERV